MEGIANNYMRKPKWHSSGIDSLLKKKKNIQYSIYLYGLS